MSKGDPLGLKGHPINDTKQIKEAVTILPTCYSHSKIHINLLCKQNILTFIFTIGIKNEHQEVIPELYQSEYPTQEVFYPIHLMQSYTTTKHLVWDEVEKYSHIDNTCILTANSTGCWRTQKNTVCINAKYPPPFPSDKYYSGTYKIKLVCNKWACQNNLHFSVIKSLSKVHGVSLFSQNNTAYTNIYSDPINFLSNLALFGSVWQHVTYELWPLYTLTCAPEVASW